MPRGGKREGAGRPGLSPRKRLLIGIWCVWRLERRQKQEALDRFKARGKSMRVALVQDETVKEVNRLRKSHLEPPAKEINRVVAPRSKRIDNILFDKILDRPVRLHSLPFSLKGHRDAILKEAAKEFGVSPFTVDKCWKSYVRLKKTSNPG